MYGRNTADRRRYRLRAHKSFVKLAALCGLTLTGVFVGTATAGAAVVYDSIPNPLPGNVQSLGYQATQTAEFGGQIGLAGTQRQDPTITLTMSSWACQTGGGATCATTPGATFSHPLTLNLYGVLPSGQPGSLIASITKTFDIPFRPSANVPVCGSGGQWSQDGTAATCFNGFANNVTFDLTGRGISLPDRVIVALAFNTQTWGEDPIGVDGPYNSLNWGLPPDPPSVGTQPRPNDAYWNTMTPSNYCDGGTGGVGIFRLDKATASPPCNWTGFQPAIQVDATPGPTGPAGATGPAGPSGGVAGAVSKSKKCNKVKDKSKRKKCHKKNR